MLYKGHLIETLKEQYGKPYFLIYSSPRKERLIGKTFALGEAVKQIDSLVKGRSLKPAPFQRPLSEPFLKSNLKGKMLIKGAKPNKEGLLTITQFAEILGFNPRTVSNQIRKWKFPFVKIRKLIRIESCFLHELIDKAGFESSLHNLVDAAVEEKKMSDKPMTKKDVAQLLNVGERPVSYWIFKLKLPYIKIGKRIRFDKVEIDRWIQKRKEEGHHARI